MSNPFPKPVVRIMAVRNRTKTGKRSSRAARRAAHYFAFGQNIRQQILANQPQQRGQWLGPNGKLYCHEEALIWAKQNAKANEYTFQALLSVPQGRLTSQDYGAALEEAGLLPDWRLVMHADTRYSHAHILFFQDKRIAKEQYLRWQEAVQQALSAREQQRLGERDIDQHLEMQPGNQLAEVSLE